MSIFGCEKKSDPAPATPQSSGSTNHTDMDDHMPDMDDHMGDKTPMDQSESSAAIAITAAIRRAVMNENGMSLSAQNCKIITDAAGVVTLTGEVASQAEKDSIETLAKTVPGVTRVDNQLTIKSN